MPDRWQGWTEVPPASTTQPWIELSHRLRDDLSRIPSFPEARFRRFKSMPADPYNGTEIQMVCHYGTHVDAPIHFIPDGPAFHQIPLDRLYGPGVVWRIDAEPYAVIGPDTLEGLRPAVRPGDIVLIDSGWAAYFGTEHYEAHPSFSTSAAQWLVERRIKLLGVDFITPDLNVNRRPPDFDWPVHHVLLSHGILIAENLTNLRALTSARVEVMFLALNIEGADGAPARVVARNSDQ